AVGQFEALLVQAPSHYRARGSLGLAYMKMGRPEEAASEFRAALSINPGFEDALRNLNEIEFKKGRE
ncbi:MAG: tetratricopeptide repeat protein, partial [Deltaproteobacteria bacterium]|nr:tetratricopeptide repeat protein [Deltaproteobacteria bacterium]